MKFKKIAMLAATTFAVFSAVPHISADTNVQKVIDETYVKPDYVLGYSLDQSQIEQTLNLLNYDSAKDKKEWKTMTPDVYSSIMNVANDDSLELYSSVKIQKLGKNKALEVNIVTPQNITKVTADMYRNAAATLGLEHAQITVASPVQVTGESALAGIYYSLEKNGAKVSQESKNLAQEELTTLAGINEENTGKKNFDADKLNVALTDIKTAVANAKNNKKDLSKDDIQKIVEETLKNYKLDGAMSSKQINLIINFAVNLSKSSVVSNKNFTKTLTDLKDSIVDKAGDTFNNINLNFDANAILKDSGNFFTNVWNAIAGFFVGIWNAIVKFFS
ncbi:MAG: DUF1002 domain-containing protein [Veillonella parvula]|uniref:DUF1002 domain-containing protein n=1 Tax=Veillonella parvula TaxID=29466 RepID=UPI00241F6236|nr:DUF1002 domain-containing protein [Veillonella parvula]MBS5752315.1 DUF1002 domain-containing protein [Veillonella parvula]